MGLSAADARRRMEEAFRANAKRPLFLAEAVSVITLTWFNESSYANGTPLASSTGSSSACVHVPFYGSGQRTLPHGL